MNITTNSDALVDPFICPKCMGNGIDPAKRKPRGYSYWKFRLENPCPACDGSGDEYPEATKS